MARPDTRDGNTPDDIELLNTPKPAQTRQKVRSSWWSFWRPRHIQPAPTLRKVSREATAGILSIITFQWINPLLVTGYLRPLEFNDIWIVNPKRRADKLANKLESSFRKRLDEGVHDPLRRALYDTLKFEFLLGGVCQLVAALAQVINPFVLRYLITFSAKAYYAHLHEYPAPHVGYGIGLVFAITILQALQSACTDQFLYRGVITGDQGRAAMICLIFDKALNISAKAKAGGEVLDYAEALSEQTKAGSEKQKKAFWTCLSKRKVQSSPKQVRSMIKEGWDNGKIINLMSVDAHRIARGFDLFHMVWTIPLQLLVTMALLIINIKATALAGFGVLIALIPVFRFAVRSMRSRRKAINQIIDQRVSMIQETLQAIRFVKYFNWEESILARIGALRRKEIRLIQGLLMVRNGLFSIFLSIPVFAAMMAFLAYGLTRSHLDPALMFSSFALFNSWRLPLSMLPRAIGSAVDASTSIKRIEEFLLAEEAKDETMWDMASANAIDVQDGCFTWEQTQQIENQTSTDPSERKPQQGQNDSSGYSSSIPFAIQNLNLQIGRNELLAVVGPVGCGKSSILAALAGEMRKTHGSVTIGASRAFCPQTAWIRNASIRENITFGSPMNVDWYDEVVEACALTPDFEALSHGDLTEVGERGITISGGQKQRLNVARAIYSSSDIILLDDPLSAVDAHVGVHIMEEAICGLLKNKCRVLATHQLWVLRKCDRILWMEHGRILAIDTLDNLLTKSFEFRQLVSDYAHRKTEEEYEQEDDTPLIKHQSQLSASRDASIDLEQEKQPADEAVSAALMQDEERAVDSISWEVYVSYAKASGSLWIVPLLLILLILAQGAQITASLWLSWWIENKFHVGRGIYLMGYTLLGVGQSLFVFAFSCALSVAGTRASKVMLRQTLTRVLRSPVSFFDTTPIGRIMNRFSRDVDVMDSMLTDAIQTFCITAAIVVSVFILIIAYYPYFAAAVAPLALVFLLAAKFYRSSARDIKRLDSVLRSTVFSRFSEAVIGVATLRAYGEQARFSRMIREAVDDMDSAAFLSHANQRWLSCRIDTIGLVLVFIVTMLNVTSRFTINPSSGGLVLSYLLFTVQLIQYTVRQLAEVEKHMNATERIHYYGTYLEQEAPSRAGEVEASWPSNGHIVFRNVQMRYRKGLAPSLNGISLDIRSGERIGIVGRTGSGKSSLINTLFRLVELSAGSISIDGIDISTIGLDDLRSRIAIIPQDPTLFRGSVRSNLDPFERSTDLTLWSALRQAGLVDDSKVETGQLPEPEHSNNTEKVASGGSRLHLDTQVEDEGRNLSLGQRQLLSIARAIVRNNRIVLCDEATSSLDYEADQKIQKTIFDGEAFKGKTVLCIAHRLRTIIHYDRICVLNQGRVIEFDQPLTLFDQRNSIFRAMCLQSQISRDILVQRPR